MSNDFFIKMRVAKKMRSIDFRWQTKIEIIACFGFPIIIALSNCSEIVKKFEERQ